MHTVLVVFLQIDWDDVAVVAFCAELACWQPAYPQERAEGPLQLHKAAELMATVMAWLHLESCECDCRSAAWPLALPQTSQNYSDEGRNCKHTCTYVVVFVTHTNKQTNSRAPYCLPPF